MCAEEYGCNITVTLSPCLTLPSLLSQSDHLCQLTGPPQTDVTVIDMRTGVDSLCCFLFPPSLSRGGCFTRGGGCLIRLSGDQTENTVLYPGMCVCMLINLDPDKWPVSFQHCVHSSWIRARSEHPNTHSLQEFPPKTTSSL